MPRNGIPLLVHSKLENNGSILKSKNGGSCWLYKVGKPKRFVIDSDSKSRQRSYQKHSTHIVWIVGVWRITVLAAFLPLIIQTWCVFHPYRLWDVNFTGKPLKKGVSVHDTVARLGMDSSRIHLLITLNMDWHGLVALAKPVFRYILWKETSVFAKMLKYQTVRC